MTLNNTILNYITSLLAGGAEQSNSEEHPFNHKRKRNKNQDIRTTLHVFDWVSYLIGSLRVFICCHSFTVGDPNYWDGEDVTTGPQERRPCRRLTWGALPQSRPEQESCITTSRQLSL